MNTDVANWLEQAPTGQKEQLLLLRKLVHESADGIDESFKWGQPCYSRKRLFCYLQRSKSHATLGFQNGARMAATESRLEGDGQQMRHVKFGVGEKIDEPLCRHLLALAVRLDDARKRTGKRILAEHKWNMYECS